MLDSFDASQAQKLLKTTLPETGHSVVVAMRPKGGKASGWWGVMGGDDHEVYGDPWRSIDRIDPWKAFYVKDC